MVLNWSSTSSCDGESAAFDAMGACHKSCYFAAGGRKADYAGCILGDAAAEVGRVTLLTESTDYPSGESDSGTDVTVTAGSLLDCA